jgi:TonB family protein
MNWQYLSPEITRVRLSAAAFCLFLTASFSVTSFAQQAQLTLADLLIGLRSKKVTLIERNKILAEAVRTRGITFALTPEIEKELETTGADKELIGSIREKSTIVKTAAIVPPKADPVPVATPAPPDHGFYQKRAAGYVSKGDWDLALADYTKAIEMDATDASDYLNRGLAHYAKGSYEKAIADFNKAIELKPKDTHAYLSRGFAVEKLGNQNLALEDFQKAFDLDNTNESAKLNLKRLQDEREKALAKQREIEAAAKAAATPAVPEFVHLGALGESNAVRMVTPTYSEIARKSGIQGKVTVEVMIDPEGNVTDAKAVSGPAFLRQSAEDAAKRSKFKPAVVSGKAIKATGTITYNFSRTGTED